MAVKIWVDDVRPAPEGYDLWCKSVWDTIIAIKNYISMYRVSGGKDYYKIELLDLDHDAGDFTKAGGDYVEILDWLEYKEISLPIRIHSMNPVGAFNMRQLLTHYGYQEI